MSPLPRPLPRPVRAPLVCAMQAALAVLALGALGAPGAAWAQAGDEALPVDGYLPLKPSAHLLETLPEAARQSQPTFVSGQRMEGQAGGVTSLEGGAELRRHDMVIRADKLEFDQRSQEATAKGQVRINVKGDRYEGPELQLNVESLEGHFTQPTFSLLKNGGQGEASRVDFLGRDKAVVHDARYSTCPRTPGQAWMPDWLLRTSRLELDNIEEVGVATGGVLEFKGMPILGAPYLSFPLTNKRKSGMLPPTINIDNISGLEVTLPYYLNLAPNFDATFYPTVMSARGVDLAGEFRYLQPSYNGLVRAAYMPSDKLRDDQRWGYSVQHDHSLDGATGLQWLGADATTGFRLNLNRVSDDNYWADFPRTTTSLTSRLLASEAAFSYARGPWSASAGVYRWQTLQDVSAPITPPYDRLPSVALRFAQSNQTLAGMDNWDWSVLTDHTRFKSNASLTGQTNAARSLAVASISRRWQAPGWYLKPRAQLHATHYSFDTTLTNGQSSATRVVPTLSLDSGMLFERDARFFGRDFRQTLEPRAFFTYTPFRDQSFLPNYDSAANDFSFASIYTENVFGGNDRISDTRALTMGVTSRLLEPASGAEIVRLGLAQRFLMQDQNVVLPTQSCVSTSVSGCTPVTNRLSDVLLGARVQWDPRWSFDANVQFNPKERQSVRTTLSGRYTPGPYKVFNAAYRLQRGSSEQLDIGWQWPLGGSAAGGVTAYGQALGPGQWYSVGRINYSVPDKKVVDLVAGFEYDAGCWIGRVVLEGLQRGSATASQRVLFQLEFSGFTRVGSNPLQSLKENIPRYQYLREEINPPSRFQQYD